MSYPSHLYTDTSHVMECMSLSLMVTQTIRRQITVHWMHIHRCNISTPVRTGQEMSTKKLQGLHLVT
jgi:hypothetical protein